MKTSLDHLPLVKQAELKAIVQAVIAGTKDVEFIILFGSYATGTWVEDQYIKNGSAFGYKSDYDLLIILTANGKANSPSHTHHITGLIRELGLETPIDPIYHGIDFINRKLSDGHYFFNDIRKDGVLLFDSGNFNLHNARTLDHWEQKLQAQNDFEFWFKNANGFLSVYEYTFNINELNIAAFQLHQTAERYFAAIHLVFDGYKPKTHDIEILYKQACEFSSRFTEVFPLGNDEDARLFDLLRKAYVDARYEKDYAITRSELQYLYDRVLILKALTGEICKLKINSFPKEKDL